MRQSLRGHPLPESPDEFLQVAREGKLRFANCLECHENFDPTNTRTPDGWAETQISGYCESCFDGLFSEVE